MQIDFNQPNHRPSPASEDAAAVDPHRRIRIAPPKTLDQLMMMEMV